MQGGRGGGRAEQLAQGWWRWVDSTGAHLLSNQQRLPAVRVGECPVHHRHLSQAVRRRGGACSAAGTAAAALQVEVEVAAGEGPLDAGAGRRVWCVQQAGGGVQQQRARHLVLARLHQHKRMHILLGPALRRRWAGGPFSGRRFSVRHGDAGRLRLSWAAGARLLSPACCSGLCDCASAGGRRVSCLSCCSLWCRAGARPGGRSRCRLYLNSRICPGRRSTLRWSCRHLCGTSLAAGQRSLCGCGGLVGRSRLSLEAGLRVWQVCIGRRLHAALLQPGAFSPRLAAQGHLLGHVPHRHRRIVAGPQKQGAGQGGQVEGVARLKHNGAESRLGRRGFTAVPPKHGVQGASLSHPLGP